MITAVEAVFHGLQKTLESTCGSANRICEGFYQAVKDGIFHSNLLNVSFYSFDGSRTS